MLFLSNKVSNFTKVYLISQNIFAVTSKHPIKSLNKLFVLENEALETAFTQQI